MTIFTNFDMDDDAELDFPFDWRAHAHGDPDVDKDWLEDGEEITAADVTIDPAGELALMQAATFVDGKVIVWLKEGVAGNSYKVSCKITTDNVPPRVDERTITIHVKER